MSGVRTLQIIFVNLLFHVGDVYRIETTDIRAYEFYKTDYLFGTWLDKYYLLILLRMLKFDFSSVFLQN